MKWQGLDSRLAVFTWRLPRPLTVTESRAVTSSTISCLYCVLGSFVCGPLATVSYLLSYVETPFNQTPMAVASGCVWFADPHAPCHGACVW